MDRGEGERGVCGGEEEMAWIEERRTSYRAGGRAGATREAGMAGR